MEHSHHIQTLFARYMEGALTAAEREELSEAAELYSQKEWEEMVLPLLEATPVNEEFNVQHWEDRIRFILQQPPVKKAVVRSLRPWKWIAAASIIVAMATGTWFIFFQKNEKPSLAKNPTPVQKEVTPGTQGAILTLADGKTIVLDSTLGNIANERGVAVINKEGQLVYDVSRLQSDVSRLPSDVSHIAYHTMTTPKGRQYQLTLADGSKVWLNAASSIRFPTAFTGKDRIVEITGEAYFEVTHNPSKPFIVSVNDMQVEVLGTHFNINSYADEGTMKTTLLEGKVRVTRNGNIAVLKPGQQAKIDDSRLTIEDDADLDEVMAWKNGLFHFNNASIQEVMRQLARWYDVDVVYQGNIPDREFGGEIARNSNLSEVLKVLEESKIHFSIEGNKLIVKP